MECRLGLTTAHLDSMMLDDGGGLWLYDSIFWNHSDIVASDTVIIELLGLKRPKKFPMKENLSLSACPAPSVFLETLRISYTTPATGASWQQSTLVDGTLTLVLKDVRQVVSCCGGPTMPPQAPRNKAVLRLLWTCINHHGPWSFGKALFPWLLACCGNTLW